MTRARSILSAGFVVLAGLVLFAGCRSAHTTSAILYIDEQNYDKAVQVIHEGFEYNDNEPDAYYYLGEAYSHLAEEAVDADDFAEAKKNYELAYQSYERAKEIDPEGFGSKVEESLEYNYTNRVRQASLDWEEGYYEQAEGHLRLAFAALPDSMTPIKNIARMKMQMSNEEAYSGQRTQLLEEALTLLDQVLTKYPEAYELQVNKANVLAALGRGDEARAIFDTLLAEHGDDTDLLLDIANLAIDQDDYERAADFYVKVVDLNEADTDASNDEYNKEMLVNAGIWYSDAKIGRYEDALACLDRAALLESIPTDNTMLNRLRAYYNYAKATKTQAEALADGDPQKAELQQKSDELFQRTIEIGVAMTNQFPANAMGFFYLSLAQLETGDYAASDANFKTYQELSPNTP